MKRWDDSVSWVESVLKVCSAPQLPLCPFVFEMGGGVVWLLSHFWLFVTPWTVALPAPLSMGFSRQQYWSGLSFPSPGNLLNQEIEPASPALQADSFPLGRRGPHTRISWLASEKAQEVFCTCLSSHPFGWKYSVSQGVIFGVAHAEPHQWHARCSDQKALAFSITVLSAWRQWRNAFKIPHGNNFLECLNYMWKLNNDSSEEQGFRKLTSYMPFLKELLVICASWKWGYKSRKREHPNSERPRNQGT